MTTSQAPPSDRTAEVALYRRAANYVAAAMIYLQDNVLLERPLEPSDVKPRLLGHWGTVPGINLMYTGLNRLILDTGASVLLVTGPGHGAPANLANLWLDGCLEEVDADLGRNRDGLATLVKRFSWPGGFPSHLAPMVPGTIHEGGELGYALATSFGAALDNPDLIVACIVGDGEAETGPTAGAWHSNKFLDPATSGAVLPMLHLNGYKIANPTIFKSMSDDELHKLFEGYGWQPSIVQGPGDEMDAAMDDALHRAHEQIRSVQEAARNGTRQARPGWPMLIVKSPKGWTGIKELDGIQVEGTSKAHQVPAMAARTNPTHLAALDGWLRSYAPDELFDDGRPVPDILACCPTGDKRMGANPHTVGGRLRTPLHLPELEKHAAATPAPGAERASALQATGGYLADVLRLNEAEKNFRIVCPDEISSNRLNAVFEATDHAYEWPLDSTDTGYASDGRVMEVLSEHNCQGWMQGYVLTGRHGLFPCYEAFIPIVEGMVNQYAKFLKMSQDDAPWRPPVSSFNYLLTSVGWRQDHNGYSHQVPGFINSMLNRKEHIARVYLPPDANTLLVTMEECLSSTNRINLVIASKHPLPSWLTLDEAREHVKRGASVWDWASNDDGEPDLVLASCGTIPAIELLATTKLLREEVPDLKIRYVNVTDLFSLSLPETHPRGMSQEDFTAMFTADRPVIFNFHGYPSAVHQLIHRRPRQERFHVKGYVEEGTTTTPFDLLAMNGVDRFQLAIEALRRADAAAADAVRGMSGAFATRGIENAAAAIEKFSQRLTELRAYVREHGDDPPEILGWTWTG